MHHTAQQRKFSKQTVPFSNLQLVHTHRISKQQGNRRKHDNFHPVSITFVQTQQNHLVHYAAADHETLLLHPQIWSYIRSQ